MNQRGVDFAGIDELFAERFEEGLTPGLVYGVVQAGELIGRGAFGTVSLSQERLPGVEDSFRIASMSKSFTAAAILLLRDRGLVDLDEAVAQYVPELVDQAPYSPTSPAVTLRMLLTHSAGLPTDDPWGDRQESLTYGQFGTFLDGGFTPGREPGTGYEYSNLGYALLGRVIENVVGEEGGNRDFVEEELLAPLGMTASAYSPDAVSSRVPGHVKRSSGWVELEPVASGAFAAMGGLHSSVADLARWVGGFVSAYADAPDVHPLSKASRREMQQLQRFVGVGASLEQGLDAVALGYGFGLKIEHDARLGQFVHHSGGYPGYGSRMVWHPESGLGVVTLSNGTYAGAYPTAMRALRLLVGRRRASGTVSPILSPVLSPVLGSVVREAVEVVTERIVSFSGQGVFADPEIFADNVELDVPEAERRRALAQVRESVGEFAPVAEPVLWSRAMAHAVWVIPAERGRVIAEILLSPEATPRIQQLLFSAVPDPAPETIAAAREALTKVPGAFGEAELVEVPESVKPEATTFLVRAGATWWRVRVPSGARTEEAGEASVVALSTFEYGRAQWWAAQA